jgi:hypothetical protein
VVLRPRPIHAVFVLGLLFGAWACPGSLHTADDDTLAPDDDDCAAGDDDAGDDDSATAEPLDARAVVLLNLQSDHQALFATRLEPYLQHLGVPYVTLDIATTEVTPAIGEHALIVIGHPGLDLDGAFLDADENATIVDAITAGTGLVSFDHDLSADGETARYPFVEDVFGFGYGGTTSAAGVEFVSPGDTGLTLDCWDDAHQDPVLATTTDASELQDTDGQWTEFHWVDGGRPFPSVFAGADEEDLGLPVMHFFASDIEPGEYEVRANLYTSGGGRDMRYHYGFEASDPRAAFVDTVGGEGGDDQHAWYVLDTVTIDDGDFHLYVVDADLLSGSYPYFGWAHVRLVSTAATDDTHWITDRHEVGDLLDTADMDLAGIDVPDAVSVLARCGDQPLLAITEVGAGRAVQWGSTDWMSHDVRGPMYGLDDLVWRSLAWAARKPFVFQGLPPLVTMRVDDVSGPLGWIEAANDVGLAPWVGLFMHDIDGSEAELLAELAAADQVTASVHAYTSSEFFYYDHGNATNWSDAFVADGHAEATEWHADHDIPISPFVLPHYYEFGTNVFDGLDAWDVQFVGTVMSPGSPYGGSSSWLPLAPYRRHEGGASSEAVPFTYADYLDVPGHPEFDDRFFVCVTEIRDDAGYEWYPDGDVTETAARGVRQLRRALDSMAVATLFTHETYIRSIDEHDWRAIMESIHAQMVDFEPQYVTQEHACAYARAMFETDIAQSNVDPATGTITLTLLGTADVATQLARFTDDGDDVALDWIDVPPFSPEITLNIP